MHLEIGIIGSKQAVRHGYLDSILSPRTVAPASRSSYYPLTGSGDPDYGSPVPVSLISICVMTYLCAKKTPPKALASLVLDLSAGSDNNKIKRLIVFLDP